jgi:arylsulfatase A-like enzyme
MKTFLLTVGAVLISYAVISQNEKPNIILIVADDAGYGDFSFAGSKEISTPNIDNIVNQGVRFTNGYVSASVCSPSRAGLLTGIYQQRFGHECNLTDDNLGLPLSERTIADELKEKDYKSIAIGKWHLGYKDIYNPVNRGFDEFFGFRGGGSDYFAKHVERNIGIKEEGSKYMTDRLADEACAFIERNKSNPFFIYLAFNAVHTPMHATAEDLKMIKNIKDESRQKLAAMTLSLDRAVGEVTQKLNQLSLRQNTLIIFINDNGGATTNSSNNAQLRGMKGSKWEGGIRVPFLLSWPNKIPSSCIYDKCVSSLDILPTILRADDSGHNLSEKYDGKDLLPFISGEIKEEPHKYLFWRRGAAAAVRSGEWKLIRANNSPILLFNLNQDIGETKNLADIRPDIVKLLMSKLTEWEKQCITPLWTEGEYWENNQTLKHRIDVIGREAEKKLP